MGSIALVNGVVVVALTTGLLANPHAQPGNLLYIMALSLICTLPLAFITSYRGKQSLLIVYLAYYFASFALQDIFNLLDGQPAVRFQSEAFMTGGELAVLLGALCFVASYQFIARCIPDHGGTVFARDWSPNAKLFLGVVFWAVGNFITIKWQFSGADSFSGVTVTNSFTGVLITFRVLQPLGTLVVIYHLITTKSRPALILFSMIVVADFFLGFVGDSKELAMRDLLLYLFSVVLLRERLPVVKTLVFVLIAGIAFNLFAAYRQIVHSRHESRAEALENIDSRLDVIKSSNKSIDERLMGGLKYFTARINLKSSVDLIVAKTGSDVPFQHGRTIEPLLYMFIPRFIFPNKPYSSMAGQLFNWEFKISASHRTYISTSQVGELYWNFGWAGVVAGMAMIGAVMAVIASSMRFDVVKTLPRFLFVLMTVYLLSLRSETALAEVYSVWGRAAVLLFVLNAIIPKTPMGALVNTVKEIETSKISVRRPVVFRLANKSKLTIKAS